jgi:hypothetical protein
MGKTLSFCDTRTPLRNRQRGLKSPPRRVNGRRAFTRGVGTNVSRDEVERDLGGRTHTKGESALEIFQGSFD